MSFKTFGCIFVYIVLVWDVVVQLVLCPKCCLISNNFFFLCFNKQLETCLTSYINTLQSLLFRIKVLCNNIFHLLKSLWYQSIRSEPFIFSEIPKVYAMTKHQELSRPAIPKMTSPTQSPSKHLFLCNLSAFPKIVHLL